MSRSMRWMGAIWRFPMQRRQQNGSQRLLVHMFLGHRSHAALGQIVRGATAPSNILPTGIQRKLRVPKRMGRAWLEVESFVAMVLIAHIPIASLRTQMGAGMMEHVCEKCHQRR